MRFEEAYTGWNTGRLTQEEAALLLGVCSRSFRRYVCRYEEEGLAGLIDRRLERPSALRAPVDEVMEITDKYRSKHQGWAVRHFYAWYNRGAEG
jgi:transposase